MKRRVEGIDHAAFEVLGRIVCPIPGRAGIDEETSVNGWEVWLRSELMVQLPWRQKYDLLWQWEKIGTVALVDGAAVTHCVLQGSEEILRAASASIVEREWRGHA